MPLEPCRVIGQQSICRRVRLVEAIARELVDQIEQLIRFCCFNLVMLRTALHEDGALLIHLRLDLLAHCTAQKICTAKRVAGKNLRGLHHLFLINKDAIGFCEDAL